jgi:hypothetical protein
VVLNYVAVPEPSAVMSVLGGLVAVGVYRIRCRRAG